MPLSQITLPLLLTATRLDRFAKAQATGTDALSTLVDGQMIDTPVIKPAEQTLARAGGTK